MPIFSVLVACGERWKLASDWGHTAGQAGHRIGCNLSQDIGAAAAGHQAAARRAAALTTAALALTATHRRRPGTTTRLCCCTRSCCTLLGLQGGGSAARGGQGRVRTVNQALLAVHRGSKCSPHSPPACLSDILCAHACIVLSSLPAAAKQFQGATELRCRSERAPHAQSLADVIEVGCCAALRARMRGDLSGQFTLAPRASTLRIEPEDSASALPPVTATPPAALPLLLGCRHCQHLALLAAAFAAQSTTLHDERSASVD